MIAFVTLWEYFVLFVAFSLEQMNKKQRGMVAKNIDMTASRNRFLTQIVQ